jgi:hypothetical protein
VHEEFVNPDRAADHEALIMEYLAMAPQHRHSMPFATFTLENGTYYYATVVDGYAGLQGFMDAWNQSMMNMGEEKMAEFMAKGEGIADHGRTSLWWERLDLSYMPEGVDVDPDTSTYRTWGWFYGKPGHEMKIEEYFKKFIELYTKHEIGRGWITYVGDIGAHVPVYVWVEMADSESAYTAMNEQISKKTGDESTKLWHDMVRHARKVDFSRGMYRPKLSYTPESKE